MSDKKPELVGEKVTVLDAEDDSIVVQTHDGIVLVILAENGGDLAVVVV